METSDSPNWTRRRLRQLGKALKEGVAPPTNCPSYDEVMLWHHELSAEVARIISDSDWTSDMPVPFTDIELRVTSRGKTLDTLVQKLRRSTLGLDEIQDLAGVRVDGNFNVLQQTMLARNIADFFGINEKGWRDLRRKPHSGYRALHLWLRCPAGRVEIQIRTEGQSAWANTYERLGDLVGRGIRYDEPAPQGAQQVVNGMHDLSDQLADLEHDLVLAYAAENMTPEQLMEVLSYFDNDRAVRQHSHEFLERLRQTMDQAMQLRSDIVRVHDLYLEHVHALRRMIEDLEEE